MSPATATASRLYVGNVASDITNTWFRLNIPLRTKTGLNAREHWSARARRVKAEHRAVALCWPRHIKAQLPCRVTLIRLGPRLADSDGVVGGLKGVRDAVAKLLGTNDGPTDPVEWGHGQRKGEWGVEIEVAWAEALQALAPEAG